MNELTDEHPTATERHDFAATLVHERTPAAESWAHDRSSSAVRAPDRPRRGRPPKDADAPHGPQEVIRAVIAVATEMFANLGYGAVSLRQVALEAGVNPGLVHRYIGSKEDLLRAVFAKFAYELEEGPDRVTGPPLSPGSEQLVHTHQRIIAHLTLEGYDISQYKTQSPIVDVILSAIHENEVVDDRAARVRALQILALGLGWRLFESFLLSATGLGDDDHEAIQEAIRKTNIVIGHGGV
jgi:TetR/AcrR family transcriptional regulator, repressor for neighboring sulfatase